MATLRAVSLLENLMTQAIDIRNPEQPPPLTLVPMQMEQNTVRDGGTLRQGRQLGQMVNIAIDLLALFEVQYLPAGNIILAFALLATSRESCAPPWSPADLFAPPWLPLHLPRAPH